MKTQVVILTLSDGTEIMYSGDAQVTSEMEKEGVTIKDIRFTEPFDWEEAEKKVLEEDEKLLKGN